VSVRATAIASGAPNEWATTTRAQNWAVLELSSRGGAYAGPGTKFDVYG
jgi:hypothetical protein